MFAVFAAVALVSASAAVDMDTHQSFGTSERSAPEHDSLVGVGGRPANQLNAELGEECLIFTFVFEVGLV